MDESNNTPIVLRDDIIETINRISRNETIEDATLHISEATAKGDNYVGKLYRVKAIDKHGKSISLIAKCAPGDNVMRKKFPIRVIFEREILTYSEILPAMDALQDEFKIPKKDRFCHAEYYESINEVEKECLFFGDLAVEGYKMYDRQKSFDNQHLEHVMKTLARLHANSFVMKKTKPELYEKLSQKVSEPLDFGEGGTILELSRTKCCTVIENAEIRKRVEDSVENPLEKYQRFVDYKRTAPYNVICHGDCWINNFLFKYEDDKILDMKFVDWQVIRLASPITDIAYMMFSSTDEQMRSDCYVRSLGQYYEALDRNITTMGCKIAECYPREVFEDQIKSTMPFGLITSMMLLPITLCERDNTPKTDLTLENYNEEMLDNLLSKSCRDRINGIARDFVSYGLI
ncbi:uncharacterized protein LOC143914722 [Arctopsyche grandis]|uniref:uncharacterized protein LOC143914722 n=1 Tax=Arctopsyche grandis TaxID=121162 RepID=UPI00406D80C4